MNRNRILPDDPRLTAYALGEMEPAEIAEFEQCLKQDAAARQIVAEIRETVASLTHALADEALPLAEQLEPSGTASVAGKPSRRLDNGLEPPEGVLNKTVKFPQFYYLVSGLAAACFAVFFVYWQHNQPVREMKRYVEVPLVGASSVAAPAPVSVELPVAQETDALGDRSSLLVAQSDQINEARKQAATGEDRDHAWAELSARETAALARKENAVNAKARVASVGGAVAGQMYYGEPSSPGGIAGSRVLSSRGYGGNKDLLTTAYSATSRNVNSEDYAFRKDNDYVRVADQPLSTFSADVDTASYANVRRFLQQGKLPPVDAVRIEEMVNYFPYDYAGPDERESNSRNESSRSASNGKPPFAAHLEVAGAPWAPEHRLVRIGLKGREVSDASRAAANLVFLIDVSGSMNQANKLPLVKQSLRLLVGKLRPDDRVAIAVYAGASGMALPSTPVSRKGEIFDAIDRLQAGGSTNGGMGIHLAYDIAKANFVTGGVNRVILATDGDFNVGVTSQGELLRLVQEKAGSGVFLSVLGFGMGNLKDGTLEQLADKGNGNYAYIDSAAEAKKTLVEQAGGTLVTIAKDVKLQVEFNPAIVQAYRLIGYENRLLAREDFNNDKVDAGEIGAGHTVTAFYEVVPVGVEINAAPGVDPLKYQKTAPAPAPSKRDGTEVNREMLTVKIRYKEPAGEVSSKLEFPLYDSGAQFEDASVDFKFASAVAAFGMVLRDSPHKGAMKLSDITAWGRAGLGRDTGGYRSEFIGLVEGSQRLLQ